MDIKEKLKILGESAKYDVSCSSSGSKRKNAGGIGNAETCGLCHSFASDGRCISLLKILMTNYCIFDCKYCINRRTNDIPRAIFTPEEIAKLTYNFYKRNYIEGLFLSSGIVKNAEYTMEKMYQAIYLLRKKYNFNGYIHAKIIPGVNENLINKIGNLVDRVSINLELPTKESLKLLANDKSKIDMNKPMNYIKENISSNFVSAGQTSQIIIGASDESDYDILKLSQDKYTNDKLKRMYYSAYIPINNDSLLPTEKAPLKRENRLYQADWLLRFYGFNVEDLLSKENPNMIYEIDPKANWALNNLDLFPIEINKASKEDLLKVPGIGPKSAYKIIKSRKNTNLDFNHLKKMNVVLKRAKYFITCNGKYYNSINLFTRKNIKENLLIADKKVEQLSMFNKDVVL